ncbi:hypothetical protein SLA2020_440770 [Shorea laevis]
MSNKATKKIREIEKHFGVPIPIIALTGHDASSAEAKKTIEAEMDVHLVKPLRREHLLEAIVMEQRQNPEYHIPVVKVQVWVFTVNLLCHAGDKPFVRNITPFGSPVVPDE